VAILPYPKVTRRWGSAPAEPREYVPKGAGGVPGCCIVPSMSEEPLDPRRIEVIDDDMARVLRAKTGAERLTIGSAMFSWARRMLINHLKEQHPDWTEDEILRETACRIFRGEILEESHQQFRDLNGPFWREIEQRNSAEEGCSKSEKD
jgi:hypothetical protein